MAYFAVVAAGYLFNFCDPILGVWEEVCSVWILLERNNQDTGVQSDGSINEVRGRI